MKNRIVLFVVLATSLSCIYVFEQPKTEEPKVEQPKVEEPSDPCAATVNPCDPLTTCTHISGIAQCSPCPDGYVDVNNNGTQCKKIDPCSPSPCAPNQKCTNDTGSPICVDCPQGYTPNHGATTCQDIDECTATPNLCGADKTCTNTPGSYICCSSACGAAGGVCTSETQCAIEHGTAGLTENFCTTTCTQLLGGACVGGGSMGLDCMKHTNIPACNQSTYFIFNSNDASCADAWDGGAIHINNACTKTNFNSKTSWCCVCTLP